MADDDDSRKLPPPPPPPPPAAPLQPNAWKKGRLGALKRAREGAAGKPAGDAGEPAEGADVTAAITDATNRIMGAMFDDYAARALAAAPMPPVPPIDAGEVPASSLGGGADVAEPASAHAARGSGTPGGGAVGPSLQVGGASSSRGVSPGAAGVSSPGGVPAHTPPTDAGVGSAGGVADAAQPSGGDVDDVVDDNPAQAGLARALNVVPFTRYVNKARRDAVLSYLASKPAHLSQCATLVFKAEEGNNWLVVQRALGAAVEKHARRFAPGVIVLAGDLGKVDIVHALPLLSKLNGFKVELASTSGVDAPGVEPRVVTPLPDDHPLAAPLVDITVLPVCDGDVVYGKGADRPRVIGANNVFSCFESGRNTLCNAVDALDVGSVLIVAATNPQIHAACAAALLLALKGVVTLCPKFAYGGGVEEKAGDPLPDQAPPPKALGIVLTLTKLQGAAASTVRDMNPGEVVKELYLGKLPHGAVVAESDDVGAPARTAAAARAALTEIVPAAGPSAGPSAPPNTLVAARARVTAALRDEALWLERAQRDGIESGLDMWLLTEELRWGLIEKKAVLPAFKAYDDFVRRNAHTLPQLMTARFALHMMGGTSVADHAYTAAASRVAIAAGMPPGAGCRGTYADLVVQSALPGPVAAAVAKLHEFGGSVLPIVQEASGGNELTAMRAIGLAGVAVKNGVAAKSCADVLAYYATDARERAAALTQRVNGADSVPPVWMADAIDIIMRLASPLSTLEAALDQLLELKNKGQLHPVGQTYVARLQALVAFISSGADIESSLKPAAAALAKAQDLFAKAVAGIGKSTQHKLAAYIDAIHTRTHRELGVEFVLDAYDFPGVGVYEFIGWLLSKFGVSFELGTRVKRQLALKDDANNRIAKTLYARAIAYFGEVPKKLRAVPRVLFVDGLESTGYAQSPRSFPGARHGRVGLSVGDVHKPAAQRGDLVSGGRDVVGVLVPCRGGETVAALGVLPPNASIKNGLLALVDCHGTAFVKGQSSLGRGWVPCDPDAATVFLVAQFADPASRYDPSSAPRLYRAFQTARLAASAIAAKPPQNPPFFPGVAGVVTKAVGDHTSYDSRLAAAIRTLVVMGWGAEDDALVYARAMVEVVECGVMVKGS